MLCLQSQSIAEPIDAAAFARDAAVEEVAGIELNPGLRGVNLQRATARRFHYSRREHQRIGRRAVSIQHEVVIVAVAVADLGVLSLIDPRADWCRCTKIEGCTGDWRDLAGRNQR